MGRYLDTLSQAADLKGISIAGAKLAFFVAGPTTTQLATYQDEALTIENTNPVIADGQGRFPDIWLQDRHYYVEFLDADDVIIDTQDNVFSLSETDIDIGYKPTVPIFITGTIGNSELLMVFASTISYVFPENLPNSVAYATTAPVISNTLTIAKNDVDVGSVTFLAGQNVGTFTWTSDVSLLNGDRLTVTAPVVADATISDIALTFQTEQVTGAVNSTYSADFYVDVGTADTIELEAVGSTVAPTAYEEGFYATFRVAAENTGAVTITVEELGTVPLTDINGDPFTAGALSADEYLEVRYSDNGSFFYVTNIAASSGSEQYAIGDIYITTLSGDPAIKWGYGTWTAIAEGLFLVGVGTGTDANAVNRAFGAGQTSGEYVHELTSGENGPHTHTFRQLEDGNDGGSETAPEQGANTQVENGITNSSGSGTAHENTPPGFGAYIWQRTA